ncbi:MAG TPA: hypothetical protein VFZ95_00865 [Steroidobacteraceae bacterium]
MNRWWLVATCACASLVQASQPAVDGLMPFDETGDGATVVISGLLTSKSFKLESVRVVGARPAGRAGDPDQFRALLLDASGNKFELVKMWSPLLAFQWDEEGVRESASQSSERFVDISIPATLQLERVSLSWPAGKSIAVVDVGEYVRKFCAERPENPACGKARAPRSL